MIIFFNIFFLFSKYFGGLLSTFCRKFDLEINGKNVIRVRTKLQNKNPGYFKLNMLFYFFNRFIYFQCKSIVSALTKGFYLKGLKC